MIKELVCDTHLLSTPCEPASADDSALVQDLCDTLASLPEGACLAANQIGVTKAACVYADDKAHQHVLLNPKLLLGLHPFMVAEGCLTREGTTVVRRFDRIKVQYHTIKDGALITHKQDFEGWDAQMVQHMIDHCKGKAV